MLFRSLVLAAVAVASPLAVESASPQRAGGAGLNADRAEKMAAACVAYAKARQAAVNIWIYDANGAMLHFERMDGAPPAGPAVGSGGVGFGLGAGGGNLDDPTAFNPGAPGAVPVLQDGRMIGTARAAGMGAIGDRACAQAAAAAAVSAGTGVQPRPQSGR